MITTLRAISLTNPRRRSPTDNLYRQKLSLLASGTTKAEVITELFRPLAATLARIKPTNKPGMGLCDDMDEWTSSVLLPMMLILRTKTNLLDGSFRKEDFNHGRRQTGGVAKGKACSGIRQRAFPKSSKRIRSDSQTGTSISRRRRLCV